MGHQQLQHQIYAWEDLARWSQQHFSYLPWRQKRTLYKTLVSEFMLQQTTVATVIPKFEAFLALYPTWEDLAKSSLEDVLKMWCGLGYYQRARRLHALVQSVSEKQFSLELSKRKWKGIGPYTLHALLAIGLNQPYLAQDANINRILKKLKIEPQSEIINKALSVLGPRILNEALMDLGRVFCKARVSLCDNCFFSSFCPSAFEESGVEKKQLEKKILRTLVRFLIPADLSQESFWGYLKSESHWVSGYVELPTFFMEEQKGLLAKQYPVIGDYLEDFVSVDSPVKTLKSTITQYRFLNRFYNIDEQSFLKLLKKCSLDKTPYSVFSRAAPWSSLTLKVL